MQKKIHVELIHLGRASYHHRIAHAKNNPEEAMSVVIDGADQAAYGIPHFPEKCKDTDKGLLFLFCSYFDIHTHQHALQCYDDSSSQPQVRRPPCMMTSRSTG
jgi:hypothetical protein